MFGFFRRGRPDPAKQRQRDAVARLDGTAETFRGAAEICGPPHSQVFWQLAGAVAELRNQVSADPEQIAHLRKLVFHFLPHMADICTRWARLAARDPLTSTDLRTIDEFESYLALIRAAQQSCLTRRYDDLALSMQVMEEQIERHAP